MIERQALIKSGFPAILWDMCHPHSLSRLLLQKPPSYIRRCDETINRLLFPVADVVTHFSARSPYVPPPLPDKDDVMLTSPDQSAPITLQSQNFCFKVVLTTFLSISLCSFCACFAWFSTSKVTFSLHSLPPRGIHSVARPLSSIFNLHFAPGTHRTCIYL